MKRHYNSMSDFERDQALRDRELEDKTISESEHAVATRRIRNAEQRFNERMKPSWGRG